MRLMSSTSADLESNLRARRAPTVMRHHQSCFVAKDPRAAIADSDLTYSDRNGVEMKLVNRRFMESNEQLVYDMLRWFDKYVKDAGPRATAVR